MANFFWGAGGQKISSPEAAARQRKVAEALMNRPAADSWQTGLANVTNGLAGMAQDNRINEAEAAGRERAGGLFADLAVNADPNSIIAALTSPDAAWASPAQTSIASALLNSGLERQDPMYQLQLQTAQAELDALQNGGGSSESFFGNPIAIQGPNGLQYGQLGNQGGFNIPSLPEGYEFLAPVQQLDTGTGFTGVDRFGKPTGQVTPIDNVQPAQDAAVGAGLGAQQLGTIEAGRNAQRNNATLGVLENLLESAPQGGQGRVVQMAGGLGVDLGGLSEVQAADALISQLVPLQRAPGSGTMSDMDLELYKRSLPSILNLPEANKLVIETQRALNDYTIAHAQIEQGLIDGRITEQEAIAQKAAIPNPLENFKAFVNRQSGAASPAAGGGVDDILQKYGVQ